MPNLPFLDLGVNRTKIPSLNSNKIPIPISSLLFSELVPIKHSLIFYLVVAYAADRACPNEITNKLEAGLRTVQPISVRKVWKFI